MSITATSPDGDSAGVPELTTLGKQLEMLRIGRGISKQHLARFAGTSRQQLWRVMTGKSELTETLRHRLAEALGVHLSLLSLDETTSSTNSASLVAHFRLPSFQVALPIETYLASAEHAERTLQTLPNGDAGRELKRSLLNALEDQAVRRDIALPTSFFELRRKVVGGEL
jgi:transcriptional regulator with XRE-family HTH domain